METPHVVLKFANHQPTPHGHKATLFARWISFKLVKFLATRTNVVFPKHRDSQLDDADVILECFFLFFYTRRTTNNNYVSAMVIHGHPWSSMVIHGRDLDEAMGHGPCNAHMELGSHSSCHIAFNGSKLPSKTTWRTWGSWKRTTTWVIDKPTGFETTKQLLVKFRCHIPI